MHAVTAYSIRCHNSDAGRKNKGENSYHYLNKIGGYDLFNLLNSFIGGAKEYVTIKETKQVYKFEPKISDAKKRIVSGWLEYGHYGIESDIINIRNNETEFEKKTDNADMTKYFYLFWVPANSRDGVALFHTVRSDGTKSVFQKQFRPYLERYTRRSLQLNPLSFDSILQEWANAETKEIVAMRLKTPNDIADIPFLSGDIHTNFTIKPHKNKSLGPFRNLLKPGTPEAKLVEELDEIGDDVKVLLQLGDRQRSFRIGKKSRRGNTEVVVPDTVELIGGVPEFNSMYNWTVSVLDDFRTRLYPNVEGL
ncbi:hypothetical protein [Oceanimonas sp. GK1]|uniref:hypothetical protein n=1 Tax=Oceanimonas sp. (strain GK1 / IBRC-M 10197) TaxID=511062 RepID=UPI0011D1E2D5|nr:hypothetical protein [Oceanimonas sp. GK1]